MTIAANSRYANSTVVILSENGQDRNVIVPSPQQALSFNYISHQMVANDRIDTVAYQYYNDATKWWQIADANPEILDYSNIPVGTILRVPYQ